MPRNRPDKPHRTVVVETLTPSERIALELSESPRRRKKGEQTSNGSDERHVARAVAHNLFVGHYARCSPCRLTFSPDPPRAPLGSVAAVRDRGRRVGRCPMCGRKPGAVREVAVPPLPPTEEEGVDAMAESFEAENV